MSYRKAPRSKQTVDAIWRVMKLILESLDFNEVVQQIVDSILLELGYLELGYEIVVLCLVDEKRKVLERISISHTTKTEKALSESPKPFHDITIPLSYKKNLLVKAFDTKSPQSTTSWIDVLMPALPEKEIERIQKIVEIKASLIYPIISRNEAIGAMIFSMSKPKSEMTEEEKDLIRSFSEIIGLAVQNASLYSQLEGANLKLKKANKDLRHLDKLKDEFVFIATHELKNPVTAMRGYLHLIKDGKYGDLPKNFKEPLEQINSANQELVQLVNDLLQIARTEAKTLKIRTKPVNCCKLSEEVMESLKPIADQKKIKLVHKCDKQEMILADPDRLKEILNNLASNAIKYSEKGTVEVFHNTDQRRKDYLVISVSDQGIGIPKKEQDKIFTRFFRSEEKEAKGIPGTGLGLFIVKQLVEKMDGFIWFTSKKGEGSTFSFSLPKAKT